MNFDFDFERVRIMEELNWAGSRVAELIESGAVAGQCTGLMRRENGLWGATIAIAAFNAAGEPMSIATEVLLGEFPGVQPEASTPA
jgi:hypothetical protein